MLCFIEAETSGEEGGSGWPLLFLYFTTKARFKIHMLSPKQKIPMDAGLQVLIWVKGNMTTMNTASMLSLCILLLNRLGREDNFFFFNFTQTLNSKKSSTTLKVEDDTWNVILNFFYHRDGSCLFD